MTISSCSAGTWRSWTLAKVKGLAPLACKTDRIDAWVLAELSRRDLVPAIWLPSPGRARETRKGPLAAASGEASHRVEEPGALIVIAFGYPRLVSDLFGARGSRPA